MTPHEALEMVRMMTHALGCCARKPGGWRNYYCADAGSSRDIQWQRLVDCGLAERTRAVVSGCSTQPYRVSAEGIQQLKYLGLRINEKEALEP